MKKYLCFALATLMLLTTLVGCNVKPVTPPDDNPTKQPGTTDPGTNPGGTTDPGTTDPGTTDPGNTEKVTEHTVSDGKFIFKESPIYEFEGNNFVIVDVSNETETDYSLTVNCTYYDEAGAEVYTESRTYDGFANDYSRPIVFMPWMSFDSYSYNIEVKPYTGTCFGENHTLVFSGLREGRSNIGSKMYPTLWGTLTESNTNTEKFFRQGTLILFDNTGEVFGIYFEGVQLVDIKLLENKLGNVGLVYRQMEGNMVWPENLTGDLRGVFVPYYSTSNVDLLYLTDYYRKNPDTPRPNPWGIYNQCLRTELGN